MEKVLDQEQIDAMVRAARGGGRASEPKTKAQVVTAWDVHQAGQIGREQMRSISTLHENFARNLTHSLGAYLRIVFAASLVSAEHLTYSEFLQRIPEVAYLASIKLAPLEAMALLQMDLSVAFSLIDVLLGGEGASAVPGREITEIEEQILETVMRILCRELETAWSALSLEFQFEYRQRPDQVRHLMTAEEKTLSISFELTLADTRGMLNIVIPAVVSNTLLRKISAGWSASKRHLPSEIGRRLRARLLECPFRAELNVASEGIPLRTLVGLHPGDLTDLRCRAGQPGILLVGGREIFTAAIARRGPLRVAQLLEMATPPEPERKQAQ